MLDALLCESTMDLTEDIIETILDMVIMNAAACLISINK
jgi:hypothetical protein